MTADVATSLKDWSATASSNQPDNSDAVGPNTLAENQRTFQSVVRAALAGGDTIASATTTDIGAKDAGYLAVSGTTTITGLGTVSAGIIKILKFDGILTLTHNGTSLILPGAANITTAAGDIAMMRSEGSGNWRCLFYGNIAGLVPKGALTTSGLTMATDKLLGRDTASTGAVEEITVGAGLSLSSGTLSASMAQIQSVSASVGSNALTISTGALSLDFRSTTLGSGTVTTVSGDPADLVISSGSTLGTVSGVQSDIVVLAINNAGTIELAAVNISGGVDLSETGLISTTAEGGAGAADSATVIYSTTARTNVAYRVIGVIRSTQATAGTWATAPSLIQGAGGQAFTAMMSLGHGQTWQNLTGSRAAATTYYNTTGRTISVSVFMTGSDGGYVYATVNGVNIPGQNSNASGVVICYMTFYVPPGGSYSVTMSAGTPTVNAWQELR